MNHTHCCYKTKERPELVEKIIITKWPGDYLRNLIMSLSIGPVKAGDIISMSAYGQVTSPHDWQLMFGSNVRLSSGADLLGIEMVESRTTNVSTKINHHVPWDHSCHWPVKANIENAFINFIGWAASANGAATGNKETLTIDQDYGTISCMVTRFE